MTMERRQLQSSLRTIAASTKHGPGGLGGEGPCDEMCAKCEAEKLLKSTWADSEEKKLRAELSAHRELLKRCEALSCIGGPLDRDIGEALERSAALLEHDPGCDMWSDEACSCQMI